MMMLEGYDDLLETEEVCDILKMSRNCVYGILKRKELKGFQQGRIWKVPKQSIILYIKKKAGLD